VHWCSAFPDARREGVGWRAPCPVTGCGTKRALEFSVYGKSVRWNSWCGDHDKDAMRPYLQALLGACFPARRAAGPRPIDHGDLIALMLSGMPPMSLKLAALEMAGMSTTAALDKLGVRRNHRSRVIAGRTGGAPKLVQRRR
jgi:hypothetical protein